MAFTTQPTNNVAGVTLGEVDVAASYQNNPVASVNVTVTLNGGGSLGGTVTQTTDGSGVAHFTNLSITTAGAKTPDCALGHRKQEQRVV